jgi:hypothetical protein
MNNKPFIFTPVELPELLKTALCLPTAGRLATSENKWTYLDIDNRYIHQLFPFLEIHSEKINKPEYFGEGLTGAHITVIYPEENKFVHHEDLGKEHRFKVKGVFTADLGLKRYYVLGIEAPSLISVRHKYGLNSQLCFKNYIIDLHITIGTAPLLHIKKHSR